MRQRSSLSRRTLILTGATAALAVIIAGLVSLPLVRGAAEAQAQTSLAKQADLVQQIATRPNDFDVDGDARPEVPSDNGRRALMGIVNYLRVQGVDVLPVIPGTSVPSQLNKDQITALAAGDSVSERVCTETTCLFIEARPVGSGTGIALLQPMSVVAPVLASAVSRIFEALVIGLVAAVIIGLWSARRLARPLRQAADAAHLLAEGERDVRLTPRGPSEVAEIAEALNTLAEQLSHSEGRQREFFLSISHELRTPLTAIKGYAEALEDGLVEPDESAKVGGVMISEVGRMDRLVSDLLDLARSDALDFPVHLSEVNLCSLVSDAADVWQSRTAREGVEFRVHLPEKPVMVRTDAVRARQIIDNLAENALRVTPAGAPIVFALSQTGLVEVRDGGPGLSPDDLAVAFEPGELYERYKGVRRVGTGFGLALVGRLSRRLHVVASAGVAPEGGAQFDLDFSGLRVPANKP